MASCRASASNSRRVSTSPPASTISDTIATFLPTNAPQWISQSRLKANAATPTEMVTVSGMASATAPARASQVAIIPHQLSRMQRTQPPSFRHSH
jgi:hypothetical protein